ncbi:MAG: serine protein kinase RIO [Candidatus Micrarchaeota archaeon]
MAILSKRKQPPREEKQIKERLKIAGKVFDDKTIDILIRYLNARVFTSVDYPLSQGKEAVVFRATSKEGFVAVKIFKYETSSFHKMLDYVQGDPRFSGEAVKGSFRSFIKLWARKEFANLKTCFEAGIRVPKPIHQRDNVVVMQFIGVGGIPCALLKDVVLENPKKFFIKLKNNMKKTFQAGLVHSDLSEFNIIVFNDEPVLIDWAQGVSKHHPKAMDFLEKDCHNVAVFFKKLGVKVSAEDLFSFVTS